MLKELVAKWNNDWRYDHWWRVKYKISFNSKEHRNANPIDVKFEFIEEHLIEEARIEREEIQKRLKHFEQTGQWLRVQDGDDEMSRELFNKIDLESYVREEG